MGGQMAGNRGFVRPMPITQEAYEKVVALTRAKAPVGGEDDGEGGTMPFRVDEMVRSLHLCHKRRLCFAPSLFS